MSIKKAIKVILIVLIVLGIAVLIELGIRNITKTREEITSRRQLEIEQEEYMQTEEYRTTVFLESCIQTTLDYIQSGDYESLYDLLDDGFKDYMNIVDVEALKEYLDQYIGKTPTTATLVSNIENNSGFVCRVSSDTEEGLRSYVVIINRTDFEEFTIIFDAADYCETLEQRYSIKKSSYEYNLKYKVKYSASTTYHVDIVNKSNTPIVGTFEGTYLAKSNGRYYYPINPDELVVNIPAGETARISLKFNDSQARQYFDDFIQFIFEDANGNVIEEISTLLEDYA